jgi:hypothetical protein
MTVARRMVALIGLCVAVAAVPVASQAASGQSLVLAFVATDVGRQVTHDVGPKGWSTGDTYGGHMKLINRVPQLGQPTRAKVGSEYLVLHSTGSRSGTVRGAAALPDGSIIVRGRFTLGRAGDGLFFPIAGGTGRFAGARGTLYINDMIGRHSEIHRYLLLLPSG